MKSLISLKNINGENTLTPVTLSGVVVPWDKTMSSSQNSDYKLVCTSGIEYFLVANYEWRRVLSFHIWCEVKVAGLLNAANLTLIPQMVFPRGPKGQKCINDLTLSLAAG